MFSLASRESKEAILEILNSAYNLLPVKTDGTVEENTPPGSLTPSTPSGSGPTPTNPDNLTAKEQKVIKDSFGGDIEKYLKRKAKYPDYVAELLEWVK